MYQMFQIIYDQIHFLLSPYLYFIVNIQLMHYNLLIALYHCSYKRSRTVIMLFNIITHYKTFYDL